MRGATSAFGPSGRELAPRVSCRGWGASSIGFDFHRYGPQRASCNDLVA
jgi:hypothetical protein